MTTIAERLAAAGIEAPDYWSGYDKRPLGRGNPYWACLGCGLSDPEINGDITKHLPNCTEVASFISARILAALQVRP